MSPLSKNPEADQRWTVYAHALGTASAAVALLLLLGPALGAIVVAVSGDRAAGWRWACSRRRSAHARC